MGDVFVFEPKYDYAFPFENGIIKVKINDRYFFIENSGNFRINIIKVQNGNIGCCCNFIFNNLYGL